MASVLLSEWALTTLEIRHEVLPVAALIGGFYVIIGWLISSHRLFAGNEVIGLIFAFLCFLSLSLMSVAYFGKVSETPPLTRVLVSEGEHLPPELAVIDPEITYIMDGGADEWIYVLFRQGLTAVPYTAIAVQEKGVLYLYSAVLSLAGDFNTYLLVVINWAAHVLSAVLLFLITHRFIDRRAAFLAAACFLVFPENLYWAGVLFKDGLVVLLVLATMYFFLRIMIDGDKRYYVFLLPVLYAIALVRAGLVIPIILAGVLSILLMRQRAGVSMGQYGALIVAGALTFALAFPTPVFRDIYENAIAKVHDKLVTGSSSRLDVQNLAFRSSREKSLVERMSGGDLDIRRFYFVPIRIAMYAFVPFPPWQVRFAGDFFILPSTWLISISLLFFFSAAARIFRSRDSPGGVLLIHFICLGAAVAFAGPFVYERYRLLLTPIYLMCGASAWVNTTRRQRALLAGGSLAMFALVFLVWRLLRG